MNKKKILIISSCVLTLLLLVLLVFLLISQNNKHSSKPEVPIIKASDVFTNSTSESFEENIAQKIGDCEPYQVYTDELGQMEYYSFFDFFDKPICGNPHESIGEIVFKPNGDKKEIFYFSYTSFENLDKDPISLLKEYFNNLNNFFDNENTSMYLMPNLTEDSSGGSMMHISSLDDLDEEKLDIIKNGGSLTIAYPLKDSTYGTARFQIHEKQLFMNLNINYFK